MRLAISRFDSTFTVPVLVIGHAEPLAEGPVSPTAAIVERYDQLKRSCEGPVARQSDTSARFKGVVLVLRRGLPSGSSQYD